MEIDKYQESLKKDLFVTLRNRISKNVDSEYVLTKTPSIHGINYFREVFPDDYLIILVRDGRNVCQSLMDSFNLSFDDALDRWNNSSEQIINYMKDDSFDAKRTILVKYEELNDNTGKQITNIFNKFNISVEEFDFTSLNDLAIVGSSQTKAESGKMDWAKKIEKNDTFKPNLRYEKWSYFMKRKYRKKCGLSAKKLGYEYFQ